MSNIPLGPAGPGLRHQAQGLSPPAVICRMNDSSVKDPGPGQGPPGPTWATEGGDSEGSPWSPRPNQKPLTPNPSSLALLHLHNALVFIDTVHKYLLLWVFSSFLGRFLCHMKTAPPDKPVCSFPCMLCMSFVSLILRPSHRI